MLVTREFVLIHVPKTGGTFLSALIREHCEVLYEDLHAPHRRLPAEYEELPALGFVRNPWDWYVSWFEHMKQRGPQSKQEWEWTAFELATADFPRFMELAFGLPRGYDYYSRLVRGLIGKAQRGRFEHLREWFVRFLRQNHIDLPDLEKAVLEAPRMNVGVHKPYHLYYDEELSQRVWESWVAQAFGYVLEASAEPASVE